MGPVGRVAIDNAESKLGLSYHIARGRGVGPPIMRTTKGNEEPLCNEIAL